jgi:hypothetical protein
MGTLGACVLVLFLVHFAGMWAVARFELEGDIWTNLRFLGWVLAALTATKCGGGPVAKLVVFILAAVFYLLISSLVPVSLLPMAQLRSSIRFADARGAIAFLARLAVS